jgi:prepilin-type processing-associated H-X9-DG protein
MSYGYNSMLVNSPYGAEQRGLGSFNGNWPGNVHDTATGKTYTQFRNDNQITFPSATVAFYESWSSNILSSSISWNGGNRAGYQSGDINCAISWDCSDVVLPYPYQDEGGGGGGAAGQPFPYGLSGGVSQGHSGGTLSNYAFCDGHVAAERAQQTVSPSNQWDTMRTNL